jgi:hypothetical protein
MGSKPKMISELYSRLHEDLDRRLAKAEPVGYGLAVPKAMAPNAPKFTSTEQVPDAA